MDHLRRLTLFAWLWYFTFAQQGYGFSGQSTGRVTLVQCEQDRIDFEHSLKRKDRETMRIYRCYDESVIPRPAIEPPPFLRRRP